MRCHEGNNQNGTEFWKDYWLCYPQDDTYLITCSDFSQRLWFVLNDYIWPIVQSGVPTRVKVRISGLSEIRIYPDHFCNRKPMPQIRIPEFWFFGGMNTILEHFFVTKYSNMGLILKVIASWFETWCQNRILAICCCISTPNILTHFPLTQPHTHIP